MRKAGEWQTIIARTTLLPGKEFRLKYYSLFGQETLQLLVYWFDI